MNSSANETIRRGGLDIEFRIGDSVENIYNWRHGVITEFYDFAGLRWATVSITLWRGSFAQAERISDLGHVKILANGNTRRGETQPR